MDSRAGKRFGDAGAAQGGGKIIPSVPGRIGSASLEAAIASAVAVPSEDHVFRREVQEAIGQALLRRGVPEGDLQPPQEQLYSSALQALRQGAHAAEIVNVVAACMDGRTGHKVLPSYIDVARQLSRDELELLRGLPRLGRSAPITHVNVILPTNQAVVVYRNVLPETLAATCAFKDNIPQYVDNLTRLGLIAVRSEDEARANTYRAMAKIPFVREFLLKAPQGSRLAVTPSSIALTDFGEGLCRACFE